jgi:mRNA-degrading endonuclease RelE of RelBE toxin-antitoxin system
MWYRVAYHDVTSYTIRLHPRANEELDNLPEDTHDRMTDTLQEVARNRAPTQHTRVKQMQGPDLYRVRVGQYRAVVSLQKPELLILRIGERGTVYREEGDIGKRLGL